MNESKKGFATFIVLLILSLIAFAGIGYFAYKNGQIRTAQNKNSLVTPSPTTNQKVCDLNKEYRSDAEVSDNCECPQDYIKKFTITGWGPCPEEGMTDCPTATFKCITPTNTPAKQNKPPVVSSDVWGIQIDRCCSCPLKIPGSRIGQDGWVKYEQGKDYSSILPGICKQTACSPCEPIDNNTFLTP